MPIKSLIFNNKLLKAFLQYEEGEGKGEGNWK